MKIYTGTGDEGRTSLFSGERLKKNNSRVAAYGTVDELCSFIGVIEAHLPECTNKSILSENLQTIQAYLFTIGAVLATSNESQDAALLQPVKKEKIEWLEQQIDMMQEELEELHCFILPGGHISAAWSHVVRTVCRRAEREILSCVEEHGCVHSAEVVAYINRLSDYFFVLARYLNMVAGSAEITWHG